MKSLILITFILFPILERAQTYELVNSTTTEEPKSHHLGFASVDLENEDESDSGCEGYGCENAPGYAPDGGYGAPSPSYGAPSPVYGSPAPSYDEPTGSGMDSMLSSIMSTDFFSSGFPMAPDFDTTMELKFQEFLSELNEPCKLAEFFKVKHLFHKCDPPSKLITLDLNGEKDVLITTKTLTRIKGSKLAQYFSNNVTENDVIMHDLPIVEEIPGIRYFIDRLSSMTEAFIQFLKSPNYCVGKDSYGPYISPNSFKAELYMYGIFDESDNKDIAHYRISKNIEKQLVCFEWNADSLK